MNMNVKMDNEDEQSIHFPNRATIALQSAPAAYINVNIVNPNLSNQGYILNPVNQVPQNLVAYQSPVTLQSYIALQETDGNLVNNLQVGVPVPIGLPVPAELLQNPNLVNTSIIIGNEDCNQPVIFKTTTNNVAEPNDIKMGYVTKPILQEMKPPPPPTPVVVTEEQNIRLSDLTALNMDSVLKKPCPLEMSIKAANIDLECDPEELISDSNGLMQTAAYPIIQKLPVQSGNQFPENMAINVPVKLNDKGMLDVATVEGKDSTKPKTEITWEFNMLQKQGTSNEFHESLICEVEEANEDEDEERGTSTSDDEGAMVPGGGVVLKLRRVQDEDGKEEADVKFVDSVKDSEKTGNKTPSHECDEELDVKKFVKVRHCCSKRECFKKITLKDQRTAHKNFYDLDSVSRQNAYLMNCIEHVPSPDVGHRSSEAPNQDTKDCGNKSGTVSSSLLENDDKMLFDAANIQLEIESESNGNQMLCDEIQKAIKESLKDCMANQIEKEDGAGEMKLAGDESKGAVSSDESGDEKRQSWNYYIVIDRCRKKVCLQFLLKLFRITKNRIKLLQGKILSGQSFSDDSSPFSSEDRTLDVWNMARVHLCAIPIEDSPKCRATPRHRYLNSEYTAERLFDNFKEFYRERSGKDFKIKLIAYKRFLTDDTNISLSRNKPDTCYECDLVAEQARKNKKKGCKNSVSVQNKIGKLERRSPTRKKGRKKWDVSSDSDSSSDDEPLAKRKNLKLTISLKGNKIQNSDPSDANKKTKATNNKTRKEAKPKGNNGIRGRDVWSLMLLHLETIPYKVCKSCVNRKRHRFFDSSMTKQGLYEDYRRYFLKETNSELGLGFALYEKYFDRNCGYAIGDVDVNTPVCPKCALEPPKPDNKSNKKLSKSVTNSRLLSRHEDTVS